MLQENVKSFGQRNERPLLTYYNCCYYVRNKYVANNEAVDSTKLTGKNKNEYTVINKKIKDTCL